MDQSELLNEFDLIFDANTAFADKLRTLVTDLIDGHGLVVHSVTSRAKQRDNFSKKVAKSGGRYKTIVDITDLVGVRVITYFSNDVDLIAQVIRQEFVIDTANSVDKRVLLDPDRFGYLSLHYVITLPPTRVGLSEYKRFAGLKAEIQIRSILQHAWAEIEHDLGYKTALGIPRDVRRQFSRLAGLLELADKEFISIREALASYKEALPLRLAQSPETVLLDKASFGTFISTNEYLKTLERKIADFAGGVLNPCPDERFEHDVASLHFLGFDSVATVEAALRQRETIILRFAKDWLEGKSDGVCQPISLLYLGYVLMGELGSVDRTIAFLDNAHIGNALDRKAIALEIMVTYGKVRWQDKNLLTIKEPI